MISVSLRIMSRGRLERPTKSVLAAVRERGGARLLFRICGSGLPPLFINLARRKAVAQRFGGRLGLLLTKLIIQNGDSG
jgi:hypothetical protein